MEENSVGEKQRDLRIDILRVLAILLIILAHGKDLPKILYNVRAFDVVLMAILLGMSYILSYKPKQSYFNYVKKRFIRLIIPTWLFLTVYFLVTNGVKLIVGAPFYEWSIVRDSYLLTGGIGFVWIIWIYFAIALVSPLIATLIIKYSGVIGRWIILTGVFIIYFSVETLNSYIKLPSFLANPFGYIFAAAIGMLILKMSKIEMLVLIGLFAVMLFISGAISNYTILSINGDKYPPGPFYLGYGMTVSLIFIYVFELIPFDRILNKVVKKVLDFISRYSLNLYFWHILVRFFIMAYRDVIYQWYFRYILMLIGTVIGTLLQIKLAPWVLDISLWKSKKKKENTPSH